MTCKPDLSHPSTARIVARQMQATPPPVSWWAQPNVTWEQWSALAAEAARRMNEVRTTHHVQRREGDA